MTPTQKLLDAEVELYSVLCDALERAWQHMPVDSYKTDDDFHTSDYARAGANRIFEAVKVYREQLGELRIKLMQ